MDLRDKPMINSIHELKNCYTLNRLDSYKAYICMASSPRKIGGIISLSQGLYYGEPWWGKKVIWEMLFFSLRAGSSEF